MQRVNVYGLGYVGLPMASYLATKGYQVLGVDVSQRVVDSVNSGKVHIVEPELDELVKSAVSSTRLTAGLSPSPADVHIIAVPTPFIGETHAPDLSFVDSAVESVCAVLKAGDLVVLESTSPVGTTERVRERIRDTRGDLGRVLVAHCPERVTPGRVVAELGSLDRVIGGVDPGSTEAAVAFYATFIQGALLPTTARTAEMAKLTENSFRDVNIAFANELSLIAHRLDLDVWEVIRLANHHPRVRILEPGPGVGGHCIAVDPWFVVHSAPEEAKLIREARMVNEGKARWVADQVAAKARACENPVIACLGATYKADTDDLRQSPALAIIKDIQQRNIGRIIVVEPHIQLLDGIELVNLNYAFENASVIVLLVAHSQFKTIDKAMLQHKLILDTKRVFANLRCK